MLSLHQKLKILAMQRSIFEFYSPSYLTLEAVLNHYIDNFYLKESSLDKVEKIKSKAIECPKMKELFGITIAHRELKSGIPTYTDFAEAIQNTPWFYLRSNKTKAVAALAAAVNWSQGINQTFYIIDDEPFRNDILLVFKKFSVFEEMSDEEFHSMRNTGKMVKIFSNHGLHNAAKELKAQKFEVQARQFIRNIIIPIYNHSKDLSDGLNIAYNKQVSSYEINDYEKRIFVLAVESADGGADIKRIAKKHGINWEALLNEEIEKLNEEGY